MVFRKIYIYLSEPQKRQVRHEMKLKASLAMIDGYGLCVCHGLEKEIENNPYKKPLRHEKITQDFINIESIADIMKCANELGSLTNETIKRETQFAKIPEPYRWFKPNIGEPVKVTTPTKNDIIRYIPWKLKRSEKEALDSCIEIWGLKEEHNGGKWLFSPLQPVKKSPYGEVIRYGSCFFEFEPITDWIRAAQDLRITCLIFCRMMGLDPFDDSFLTLDQKNVVLLDAKKEDTSPLSIFYQKLFDEARLSNGTLTEAQQTHSFHVFFNEQPTTEDALSAVNLMMPKYRKEFYLGDETYPLIETPESFKIEESCTLQNIWKDAVNGFLSKKISVCQKCGRITYGSLRAKKYCSKSHENKDVIEKPALSRIRLV